MRVMPASRAAWMVAIDRWRSGRPSIDMGMAPRPMAETVTSPMVRVFIRVPFVVEGGGGRAGCGWSPRIVLRGGLVPREQRVELVEGVFVERDVDGGDRRVPLFHGPRPG